MIRHFFCLLLLAVFAGSAKAGNDRAPDAQQPGGCGSEEGLSTILFRYDSCCNTLFMRILRADLVVNQPDQAAYLDAHDTYCFEEEFVFPEDMRVQLGLPQPATICSGEYEVVKEPQYYAVVIRL